ncbi:unnamed protein product [Didymodactylos carnosus]|uniref:HAT C-terminal dimerisation domain-containing protein n=1 Tax=Didymodactylos carnosus TaxID=1234261 RepID=A0A8S2HFT0_9BILA|nr:unnamed protein product [Didymodactylos carnosus]CAF3642101.1 unnamed protein product [Didymodactylos carnosus]
MKGPCSTQSTLKKSAIPLVQKRILDAIAIQCVIEDGRSFSDLRKAGMMKLLDALLPGYIAPHRNTIQRNLEGLYNYHYAKLAQQLKEVNYISLTCDFWSDRRLQSYLVITGHFVDVNFKLASKIICFTQFRHRHMSKTIAETIIEKLKNLGVYEKITSITCDNASNMVKMFDSLRDGVTRLGCIAHKLHLVICNALCLWTKPQKQRPQPTKTTTTTASTNSARRSSTDNTFSALTAAISGSSVTVDSSDYSDGEDNEQHADIDMENLLLYDDSIDPSDGTSPLNNRTSPDRDDELSDTEESGGYNEYTGYDLSADDWNKLSTVQSVLEIFVAATTTMSASSYPTVGIELFFIRRIKAHLEPSTYYFESDPEQVDALKLRAWFDPIALDVMTTKEKVALEREIKSISKNLSDNANTVPPPITTTANNATTNISPSSSSTQGSTSSRKSEDPMRWFLRLTGQENSSESKQKPTSIAGEIALYSSMAQKKNAIALKSEPLSFWSKHGDELPLFKELASKYLTTPGTSVPSESAFSVAGFVGRKERARLTAKTLSYLVFLKDKI